MICSRFIYNKWNILISSLCIICDSDFRKHYFNDLGHDPLIFHMLYRFSERVPFSRRVLLHFFSKTALKCVRILGIVVHGLHNPYFWGKLRLVDYLSSGVLNCMKTKAFQCPQSFQHQYGKLLGAEEPPGCLRNGEMAQLENGASQNFCTDQQ